MQTASNGTFGHCPESASHHTMLKLTCETFWPLKDLDTFTATFVALEACLLPPIQEAHRIGTYCHIGISEKKKRWKNLRPVHMFSRRLSSFFFPFILFFGLRKEHHFKISSFLQPPFHPFSAWIPTVTSPLSNCTWGCCLSVWSLHVVHRFFN